MRIFALELNNDIKGLDQRKAYIESLVATLERPDLIVLPELSLCSYMGNTTVWECADLNCQMTSQWAMGIAKKFNTCVAVGFVEKNAGDFFNSYLVADKHKVHGVVRKSEGESYVFKRGNFTSMISTPFGDVAVGICYDSRRRHFYENIKDHAVSLILFPHGSPHDPSDLEGERRANEYLCNTYVEAFGVPVVYVNSIGKMDSMLGKTGNMMIKAGFRLNGLSEIYGSSGTSLPSPVQEAIGMDIELMPKRRTKSIRFYGDDLSRGNFLFRKIILKPDIKAGIRMYEKMKGSLEP
jgi:predicted amidohydrolase